MIHYFSGFAGHVHTCRMFSSTSWHSRHIGEVVCVSVCSCCCVGVIEANNLNISLDLLYCV